MTTRFYECAPSCRLCATLADRRPRTTVYAEPRPSLHLSDVAMRDAGHAGARLASLVVTEGA